MSTTKHTTIEQLKKLALRTKSEIGLVDAKVAGLTTKVNDLVTAGGEPNKLEGIKVNGTLLALTDKIADILIAEGKTNGTVSANGVDIPVHGLAALAYKSEVAEGDLAAALKAIIDAKAKQADLDTLTGDGEGSISKMIDAAINKFATDVTDDNVVNSYKELIDWVAKHGPEATKMAGGISEQDRYRRPEDSCRHAARGCDLYHRCRLHHRGDQCSEHRRLRQDDRGDCRDQHRP